MNKILQMIDQNVKQYGLAIQFVFPTRDDPSPSFAYTIGMTDINLPEFIVFGFPNELAGHLMNMIYHEIKEGTRTGREPVVSEVMSVDMRSEKVDLAIAREYGVQAIEYYKLQGKKVEFSQLVWPDAQGRYPNDTGVSDSFKEAQPYLPSMSLEKINDRKVTTDNGPKGK